MRRLAPLLLAGLAFGGLAAAAPDPARKDYAALALNVLPPGQNGSLQFDKHTTDQVKLYDCLTPLFDQVRAKDLRRCFKRAPLGMSGKAARTERPRRNVVIRRDSWGVPHITGKTQEDVAFATGWATAEDRGLLLELLRGPARAAALDIPGLSPVELALSGQTFVPSAQTEAFLAEQLRLLEARGRTGARMLALADAYTDGINTYYSRTRTPVVPYTTNDVAAVAALLIARFGANGGSEVRRSMFLDALEARLGAAKGRAVFDDLRASDDEEAPTIVQGRFPYELPSGPGPGSVVIDDGSFEPIGVSGPAAPIARRRPASNAVLIGATRSKSGHPLFVAGPQVGYFFPEFFMEVDLYGGGFDVRGALLPGVPLVLIGRGPDFAWSATSSQADNQDIFVETLCGDDRRYFYQGECREMTTFDAGTLKGGGKPDREVTLRLTVHGVVQGYATVEGRRVAVSFQRSTRGREVLSTLPLYSIDTGRVTSAKTFVQTLGGVEAMFNLFYADDRDIAMISTGRLPLRAPGTDPSLPTVGTGDYEWRGFLPLAGHAQAINQGTIVDWNTKPAAGFGAADDNWSYGSVQRKQLLTGAVPSGKLDAAKVVGAVNKAATQDLRVLQVWPVVSSVLSGGSAPSSTLARMVELLDGWRSRGGSRLDRNLDGQVDDPGTAIMDAAWPEIARAVMTPVLGPLTERLARLHVVSDDANSQGSSYFDGWYGYVEKDLRTILDRPVRGLYNVRYCGDGVLAACRASLWDALEAARAKLAASQGPDPDAWRADATRERIDFTTGLIPDTMRWANRPTFHQVMSFDGHRRR